MNVESKGEVANVNNIAGTQYTLLDLDTVNVGAIGGAEIVHPPTPKGIEDQFRMTARDRGVVKNDLRGWVPADDQVTIGQWNALNAW